MSTQDMIMQGLQGAMTQGKAEATKQAKIMNDLLTEIRDNQNGNFIWCMEAIQEICNKLDIKLRDPLEIETQKEVKE